ncbi:acylphosphatase [Hymenobacter metallilatus]|uniref:acylphosphatase n=1 Tax=Hymenobacter metallilatus TaxID=2493666 RepID=A0A3R9UN51_9BACT|nr:acylphosphatase [Hymenobacter metallilatus]RSK35956.1 acylphosphatase [Hymenobacter metallilatus]
MTTTPEHRTIHVYGRVQGVFFRQSTQQQAHRLGLTGTVRNNPDGSVTIQAEGPAEALNRLEAWCQQGPPAANVTRVTPVPGPVEGYTGFQIER